MNNEGISTMYAPDYRITSAGGSCDSRCLFVCQQIYSKKFGTNFNEIGMKF